MAGLAFAGFTTLTPTLYLGLNWRRFTAQGAIASLIGGNAVLYLGQAGMIPPFGFRPVFWAFTVALSMALDVSLSTSRASGV